MIGRRYTVAFENVAVGTAAQDLFELIPASDKPFAIVSIELHNVGGAADAGDAQEELIRLTLKTGHTTGGSGGGTPTPRPLNVADAAAGLTAETNNTTVASAGTALTIFAWGWNVRVPFEKVFTPESMPIVKTADSRVVLRSESTLADAITMSGTIVVEEI